LTESATPTLTPTQASTRTNTPSAGIGNPTQALILAPNPAQQRVAAIITLAGPAQARILLFDLTGRLVFERELGACPAGTSRTNVDLGSLADGLYFAVLESDLGGGFTKNGVFKLAEFRK
jgi:hypothetical protein